MAEPACADCGHAHRGIEPCAEVDRWGSMEYSYPCRCWKFKPEGPKEAT